MAVTKKIKPLGGGDYTELTAWENYAGGEDNAGQYAEVYAGGDVGVITITGWNDTPNATDYPKVFAAAGNQHDGTGQNANADVAYGTNEDGAAACINALIGFVRVEGMRYEVTGAVGSPRCIEFDTAGFNGRVTNCELINSSSVQLGNFGWGVGDNCTYTAGTHVFYLTNNIFINKNTVADRGSHSFKLDANGAEAGGPCVINLYAHHNTMKGLDSNSGSFSVDVSTLGIALNVNVYASNNAEYGSKSGQDAWVTADDGTATVTFSEVQNNASDDTSCTDNWSGSGTVTGLSGTAFSDATNFDMRPASGGLLAGAGASSVTEGPTTDAVGNALNDPPDIGAMQLQSSGVWSRHRLQPGSRRLSAMHRPSII